MSAHNIQMFFTYPKILEKQKHKGDINVVRGGGDDPLSLYKTEPSTSTCILEDFQVVIHLS